MSNTFSEQDLQLWIEQTIKQLKNREFEALDIEHLAFPPLWGKLSQNLHFLLFPVPCSLTHFNF